MSLNCDHESILWEIQEKRKCYYAYVKDVSDQQFSTKVLDRIFKDYYKYLYMYFARWFRVLPLITTRTNLPIFSLGYRTRRLGDKWFKL